MTNGPSIDVPFRVPFRFHLAAEPEAPEEEEEERRPEASDPSGINGTQQQEESKVKDTDRFIVAFSQE